MPNTPADIVKQTATTSLSSWCVFRWSKHICAPISWRFFLSFSAVILCLPPFAYGWLPGSGNPTATNGFVVNTSNRRDVLAFYQTIYKASEGYLARMGWTGDVSTGIAGTTSDLFKADVLRRVNFYRALVGLPADITLNSVKSSKDQDDALWISANGYLTHYPTGGYFYKATVADAASHSNIAWGLFGPGAIDGYIDDSGNESTLGHRRWIMYSLASEMGTGDIPENSSGRAANALWVIGDAKSSSAKKFVPWPNAGFTPINFVHSTWSVSYPGANFNSAKITVTQRGSGVSHQYSGWVSDGYGDNTLMWTPSEVPSSISADTTFDISISGIGGQGVPSSYNYSVTLFDPAVLGDSISIYGDTAPPTTGASYSFSSVEQADQYELRVYSSSSSTSTEGAESSPTPKVQLITTGSYSVIQSATKFSGSKAFHLAFPDFNDQVFEISRDFIPSATSYLKFYDLGRFASTSTTLNAEVSTDNGLTWQAIWSRSGVGLSSSSFDSQFNTRSVSLSTYAGKPIRVRFALRRNGSSIVVNTVDNCGFFLDDISVTNSTELVNAVSTILAGTTTDFSLNSTTAGSALVAGAPYYMRIRPMVGGQWFDFGALKTVFPTQSLSPTITSQPAALAVNVGSPASFSVTATGTGSLSCQWRKDGANIAGATSVTYTIASVQTTDAGSYSAVVSNSAGSVTSGSASLTVNKAAQTIGAFGAIGSHLYGDAPFAVPVPVANSGLTVSVTLKSGPATISGGSILVNGVGIVVLAANQAGNANYTAAAEVTTSFNVNKATPTIYVWPSTSSISSGQTLVSSVLSGGSASVLGAFAFSSSSTAPSVGTGTQAVTFTPTDSTRYNTVSGNVSVTVNAVLTAPSITSSPASLTVNGGSLASFSVTATGTAPLGYQWRKNGTNLSGGTSSTYVIASAQTTDAGSYSVVVSNSAGSVTSASASLTVNKVTPVITILPTASPITPGQSLTASVLSGGSASVAGIFAFTSPSTVPSVGTTSQSVTFTPTDSSRYTPVSTALSVTVNAAVGLPVITSATTATGTVGSAFNYQIAGTNTPSSYTATGLPAGLTVNSITGVISGMPSIAGQSLVTLGALNSGGTGSATLTVSILAAGTGGTGTVSWTDLVGTYEGLLEQNPDSPSDDMAVYRGAFSLTFSRTGTVSGRVFYNEATALDGSQNRVYVPVIRTFVGMLNATSANSLIYQKVIRLGTGTSLGRQELTLDVSFEETPPRLSVTVKDTASPSAGEDAWVSQALSCSRSLTKLPASTSVGGGTLDYSKAVGRYTLSATDGDPTGVNNAYVLAQLLSTGKVLWTSRMKGTLGTGSTGLRVTSDGLNASFYEGRVSSTSASLKSTSVLGSLNFVCTSGSWSSNFGSEPLLGKVERQASYVSKTGGKLAFNDAQDSTGVTVLDFSNQDGVRWGNTALTTLPTFLSGSALSSSTFTLSAQDPLTDSGGNTVSYAWNVSVASTGKVSTTSTTEGTGVLSPRLLLTLNRQNGEFAGYYVSSISGKSVRRNIYGCGLISDVDGTLRARGWVESGVLPTLSTGEWKLQLGP